MSFTDEVKGYPVKVAWGAKLSDDFLDQLFVMCRDFGWYNVDQLNDIIACMAFETGGTFSPNVRNGAGSGAVGLIQFMPATLKGMGYTVAQVLAMSAVEQLVLLREYFKPYYRRIATLPDMYMAILMPKYVNASSSAVLFSEDTIAYRQNSGLDSNDDGEITKYEAAEKPREWLKRGLESGNSRTVSGF